MITFALQALVVFILLIITDFVWTRYTQSVTAERPYSAAVYTAFIILCSGVSTISYVHDPRLLVPAVVGGMVGTVVAMRWKRKG